MPGLNNESTRNAAGGSFNERSSRVKVFGSWAFVLVVQQQLDILGVQHIPGCPWKEPGK
jgi:hypothetical protein